MRASRLAIAAGGSRSSFGLLVLALCTGCSGKDIVLGLGALDADAGAAGADTGAAGADAAAAPGDAAPEPDAATGLPRFSEPTPIESIFDSDATDDDPSLTADLTLLYFNSIRAGSLGEDEDIWFSVRADPSAEWGPPQPADELNTEQRETGIALAPDGLSILWSSDRPGGAGGLDVYMATRASRDAAWSGIARVAELSSEGDDLISALAEGGRRALLARRADEDDDYALFTAERAAVDVPFGAPTAIAELDADGEESDAFMIAGGTGLLFTRGGDLYFAQRAAAGGPFGEPMRVTDLNSDQDDRDAWASDDLGYVVFSSKRSGKHRLYEARRR